MKYFLKEKPKNVILIQGLPSLGLVSTITIKYLLDHLDTREIGYLETEHLVPLTAIHKGKIVNPITLYYNKKFNLVLLHSLSEITGIEWELAEAVHALAKDLKTKEVIVIEGMPPHEKEKINLYYYSEKKKMKAVKPLEEGIVMGATAALLLKCKDIPVTCLFAEAHSQLPDSEAAAKVVEALNVYLGLKVDVMPLQVAAKKFEMNLKQFIEKTKERIAPSQAPNPRRETNYIG